MLDTSNIEIDVAPVLVGTAADKGLAVAGVHVSQIVGRRACEARHRRQLVGIALGRVPALDARQRRFAPRPWGRSCRSRAASAAAYRAAARVPRRPYSISETARPSSAGAENGVAQAVVDKAFAQPAALDLGEHVFDSLLYIHAVEHVGVDESARLGVVRLLLDIAALDHRHDLQTEVAREGVVARVVRRHGHNGAGTVSGKYIVRDIDRDAAAGKGVYGIRTRSHAAHAPRLGDTLTLRAQLRLGDVLLDVCAGGIGRQLADPLVLGCDDHERHAVDSIGTRREDLQLTLRALYIEEYLRTDRAADPVALYLFQRIAPFERIQAVEHALCVCRHRAAATASCASVPRDNRRAPTVRP